ncbi:MAG: hypothetical protein GY850_46585 [bacterium]|nr:hypothetical protein [bacterium]
MKNLHLLPNQILNGCYTFFYLKTIWHNACKINSQYSIKNCYTGSLGKPEAFVMRIVPINLNSKSSIKDKGRLNICIAKDLADDFGGGKSDY